MMWRSGKFTLIHADLKLRSKAHASHQGMEHLRKHFGVIALVLSS